MYINYQKFLSEAMLEVVKKVLKQAETEGLESAHHFYITFRTLDPLVVLSAKMKQRYPEEITIVLQYQFENLIVDDNKFSVRLNFNGVRENLEIPFRAITSFIDPSVNFKLEFQYKTGNGDISQDNTKDSLEKTAVIKNKKTSNNIIALDKFRHKNKDA